MNAENLKNVNIIEESISFMKKIVNFDDKLS
jgi:hypothetical protein